MDKLLYLLPILACPIMMGLMMWMMRSQHSGRNKPAQPDVNTQEEIAVLRAEIATLRAQQGGRADRAEPGTKP